MRVQGEPMFSVNYKQYLRIGAFREKERTAVDRIAGATIKVALVT
jgi:hypothetical protein